MQVLVVQASPRLEESATRSMTRDLVSKLMVLNPTAKVTLRDLALEPLPHLSQHEITSAFTPPEHRTSELQKAIRLSDQLVDELLAADIIILSTPMWNFSIPSSLKAWIDHIVRVGRTFSYSASGPQGLVTDKPVFLVTASGSVYSTDFMRPYNFLEPYLRTVLGFIGIRTVHLITAEGLSDPGTALAEPPTLKLSDLRAILNNTK
ncbi:MAG TPA: NAD(P)H-dependent oxidoreductase [Oligoflexus sp.]|uniref:FMN-dependent NADH-azoreductase n=1 Tax=Oligoflexus sp. TaxID=1971216 RepID=UPI002D3A5721|nr:NAD(P)H-dependent oxidoreductase [Oligoflexus sp.]HYX39130.1 NAD(P)H-dependent oxidoreductase [Oligoflexus sp.]